MRFFSLLILLCLILCPKIVSANEVMIQQLQQSVTELTALVKDQSLMISQLTNRVSVLEGTQSNVGKTIKSQQPSISKHDKKEIYHGINPKIGVTGTVLAKLTESKEDGEVNDTIALQELELTLKQHINEASGVETTLTFNDGIESQNVEIEEAFYTNWGLPYGFKGQIGKFRPKIGKQNLQHLHELDTVNYALIIQDFFGEEGMAASGARIQNNLPTPFDIPLEVTAEILRGNEGNSFSGVSRRPIFNTHVSTFFKPTDNSNVEIGGTFMSGNQTDNSKFDLHIFGADLTANWFLEDGKKVKFQNEIYVQDREGATVENPWGFYSILDFLFHPKFSTGIRFDHVQASGANAEIEGKVSKLSPYLTFWQSDLVNFRFQYSRTEVEDADVKKNNEVFLQANFKIGSHEHHDH